MGSPSRRRHGCAYTSNGTYVLLGVHLDVLVHTGLPLSSWGSSARPSGIRRRGAHGRRATSSGSTSPPGPLRNRSHICDSASRSGFTSMRVAPASRAIIGHGRGGVDHAGRADDEHDVAAGAELLGGADRVGRQSLAEPDDLGAEVVAALGAARRLLVLVGEVLPVEAAVPALDTTEAVHGAVELDHLRRAGALMQPVDVLRDDHDLGEQLLELGDGPVAGVGLSVGRHAEAVLVPAPDERRVLAIRLRRGQLHRVVLRPQAGLGLAEGGDAGLLADAGSGEHREPGRPGQGAGCRLEGVVGSRIVEPVAHGSLLGRVLRTA